LGIYKINFCNYFFFLLIKDDDAVLIVFGNQLYELRAVPSGELLDKGRLQASIFNNPLFIGNTFYTKDKEIEVCINKTFIMIIINIYFHL
jgi:hypothetical protein